MGEIWQDSGAWSYDARKGNILVERFRGKLFDSYFGKNSHPTQNHSLKLFLRVYLRPVNNQASAADANSKIFPIKNWTPDEWLHFTAQFERQSAMWNNRFWLIPPKSFSLFDAEYGGRAVRPNIHCFLFTQVTGSAAGAHRTVDVVNLDVAAIKRQKNISRQGSGTFRSNDTHYDSLDASPRDVRYDDDRGVEHTIKNHYTIAHELGHAIGLSHVGVLKSRPQCTFAIALKSNGVKNVSSHLARGSNAKVCYGEFDSPGLAENIMGLGTKFEEINARPWVDRAVMHTNTLGRDWQVSLAHVSPRGVL